MGQGWRLEVGGLEVIDDGADPLLAAEGRAVERAHDDGLAAPGGRTGRRRCASRSSRTNQSGSKAMPAPSTASSRSTWPALLENVTFIRTRAERPSPTRCQASALASKTWVSASCLASASGDFGVPRRFK